MTEEIKVPKEETIFVNLFKNTREKNGRQLISYKPGYVKKGTENEIGTYPVGFGTFDVEKDGDYERNVYHNTFWLTVEANGDDKGDIKITLQDTVNKEYSNYFLVKKVKDGKVSFGSDKPLEIEGKRYWANLTQNTKKDKPHLFNLIFKEA